MFNTRWVFCAVTRLCSVNARRGRRPRHPVPAVGEGLALPADSRLPRGIAPVGDAVLDVPCWFRNRATVFAETSVPAVGADALGGPLSGTRAGCIKRGNVIYRRRGRRPRRPALVSHHPVGEGLAPPADSRRARYSHPRRRGRRPRRPVLVSHHVRPPPVGEGLAPPADSRRSRYSHPAVGAGVLDVPLPDTRAGCIKRGNVMSRRRGRRPRRPALYLRDKSVTQALLSQGYKT